MERINKLKHHLVGTHDGVKPCTKVSGGVRLESKETLNNFRKKKIKKECIAWINWHGLKSNEWECILLNSWK